jgi:hypothetical protein
MTEKIETRLSVKREAVAILIVAVCVAYLLGQANAQRYEVVSRDGNQFPMMLDRKTGTLYQYYDYKVWGVAASLPD